MIGEAQAISDVEQRETRREIKAGVLRSADGTRAHEPFWGPPASILCLCWLRTMLKAELH